jgi:RHS repeat-associated protein
MKVKHIILLVVFTVTSVVKSYAGNSIYNSSILSGSNLHSSSIGNPVNINLKDDWYGNMSSTSYGTWFPFINHKVKDYVSLQYTGTQRLTYTNPWSVKVTFYVIQYDTAGKPLSSFTPPTTTLPQLQTLIIQYDPARGVTDEVYRSDYESDWGDSISIQVQTVTVNGLASVPADVELSGRIVVDRYWKLDINTYQYISPFVVGKLSPSSTNNPATIDVAWSYQQGAESYDLEWLFRSDFMAAGFEDFSQATRVNLSGNFYQINNVFDAGWVLYRVRSVGTMGPDNPERKEGVWSLYDSVHVGDIDAARNWTYSAAYAEEGKRKEVLSFFDGSTRQRQAVTENNSQNIALISETVYDHEGRAGVTTLAAPDATDDATLKFYSQENISSSPGGKEYSAADFDNDVFGICSSIAPHGLNSSQGSSNYYSPSNPLLNMGFNKAIPDANLYPFTETLYGPDGKVAEQSGPGPALAMGGNTTKYFYGTPLQPDLDRVFGNEAGNSNHYQEKVVEDPNGQVSVSYLNLSGKVVATSLAGASPTNMQPLTNEPGNGPTTYTADISNLNSEVGTGNGQEMSLTDDIVITAPGTTYSFTYNFHPAIYSPPCPTDGLYGMYDLLLDVTDNCGNVVGINSVTYSGSSRYSASTSPNGLVSNNTYITYTGNAIYSAGSSINFTGTVSNSLATVAMGSVVSDDGGLMIVSSYAPASYNLIGAYLGGSSVVGVDYTIAQPNVQITIPNADAASGLYFVQGQTINFEDPTTKSVIASGTVATSTPGSTTIIVSNVSGSRAIDVNDIIPAATVTSIIDPSVSEINSTGGGNQIVGTGINAAFQVTFSVAFPQIGTYHVSKVLSIDPTGVVDAAASFNALYPNGCSGVSSLATQQSTYISAVNTAECSTCQQNCVSVAAQMYPSDDESQKRYVAECDNACAQNPVTQTDPCTALKNSIDADMSPGGQYFDDDPQGSTAGNVDNNWLIANIGATPPSGFLTAISASCSATNTSGWSWDDVRTYWNDCFVTYLEQYHPEYCRLNVCNATDCSKNFDQVLANNNTLFSYAQRGFVAPSGTTCPATTNLPLLNVYNDISNGITIPVASGGDNNPDPSGMLASDPFFNVSFPNSYQQFAIASMTGQLANYTDYTPATTTACSSIGNVSYSGMSMWQVALTNANILRVCDNNTTGLDNLAWQLFVGYYEKEKLAVVETYINNIITNVPSMNFCLPLCDAGIFAGGIPTGVAGVNTGVNCNTPSSAFGFAIRDEDLSNTFPSAVNASTGPNYVNNASNEYGLCHPTGFRALHYWTFLSSGTDGSGEPILQFYCPESPDGVSAPSGVCTVTGGLVDPGTGGIINSFLQSPLTFNVNTTTPQQFMNDLVSAITNSSNSNGGYTATLFPTPTYDAPGNYYVWYYYINAPSYIAADPGESWLLLDGNNVNCQTDASRYFSPSEFTCPPPPSYPAPSCFCSLVNQIAYPNSQPGQTNPPLTTAEAATVAAQINNTYSLFGSSAISGNDVLLWQSNCSTYGQALNPNIAINDPSQPAQPPAAANCDASPPCTQDAYNIAGYNAYQQYTQQLSAQEQQFLGQYEAAMFSSNNAYSENESVDYPIDQYHYTLYYYDQAGNLIHTVPPSGVNILGSNDVATVDNLRSSGATTGLYLLTQTGGPVLPHSKITTYVYNSLNELMIETTPDAGTTNHYYDHVGRLRITQNLQQANQSPPLISYTRYDGQGRIVEVGESDQTYTPGTTDLNAVDANSVSLFPLASVGNFDQVTSTYYDAVVDYLVQAQFDGGAQQNLRSRVSTVTLTSLGNPANYNYATHYSYDEHGNVTNLVQENTDLNYFGQEYKKMRYDYDLISGNVKMAKYQPGQIDQFSHKYEYDADNRITNAYTSTDCVIWDQDAKYFYYLHGPMAREEIGQDKVHGCDYAYTLQGWLKGVNSNVIAEPDDIGADGMQPTDVSYLPNQAGIHSNIAQDAYGFTLSYFTGNGNPGTSDYTAINGALNATGISSFYSNYQQQSQSEDLYNGNIKQMDVALTYSSGTPMSLIDNHYKYDQLNRIMCDNVYTYNSGADYSTTTNPGDYGSSYTYNPDGNILTLKRTGHNTGTITPKDNLAYAYTPGTNQLLNVTQGAYLSGPLNFGALPSNVSQYNYNYIGQLTSDQNSSINNITWSIYGKVLSITGAGTQPDEFFTYDAMGNRISKLVKPRSGGVLTTQDQWTYTYYVRDASGNIMAIYDRNFVNNKTTSQVQVSLAENPIYGSKRVGDVNRNLLVAAVTFTSFTANSDGTVTISGGGPLTITNPTPNYYNRNLGYKNYELTDHLGNVMMTITDRKLGSGPSFTGVSEPVTNYIADISSSNDYYPFGATMPFRQSGSAYRFAYNGKEQDPETYGTDNEYDYGMRMYNPRLGRFMSVDPITREYPMLTPYQFASNRPIDGIDQDGFEYAHYDIIYDYDNQRIDINFRWENENQHNEPGKLGRGVEYHWIKKEKDVRTEITSLFYPRQETTLFGLVYTDYGNYMGSLILHDLDPSTGGFSKNKKKEDYRADAVDAVDQYAKLHDWAYDKLGAEGSGGLFSDWATTYIDETAEAGWESVLKIGIGGIDPFNNQKITYDEVDAANNATLLFSFSIASKKADIIDFMKSNKYFISNTDNWNDNDYYQSFKNIYLTKDKDGDLIRRDGYWRQAYGGEMVPIPLNDVGYTIQSK